MPLIQTKSELTKPCPFCGGTRIHYSEHPSIVTLTVHRFLCKSCNTAVHVEARTKKFALLRWNGRKE